MHASAWQIALLVPLILVIYGLSRLLRLRSGDALWAPLSRFLIVSILVHVGLLFALDLMLITMPVVEAHRELIESVVLKTFSIFPTNPTVPQPWEKMPEGPPLAEPLSKPVELAANPAVSFAPELKGLAPTISDALARSLPPERVLFIPKPDPDPKDARPSDLPRTLARVEPRLPALEVPPLPRTEPPKEPAPEPPADPTGPPRSEPRPGLPDPKVGLASELKAEPIEIARVVTPPPPPESVPAPAIAERSLPLLTEPPVPEPVAPARVPQGDEPLLASPGLEVARATSMAAEVRTEPKALPPASSPALAPSLSPGLTIARREPEVPKLDQPEVPEGTRPRGPVAAVEPAVSMPPARVVGPLQDSPIAEPAMTIERQAIGAAQLPRAGVNPAGLSATALNPLAPALSKPLELARSRIEPKLDIASPALPAPRLPARGAPVLFARDHLEISASFALRRAEIRKDVVAAMGGNQASESAVGRGLVWLAAHQGGDGNWSIHDLHCKGHSCGEIGDVHSDAAATGLALMAFLGAGHSQKEGKYADVVKRGVSWLVAHQEPSGNLAEPNGSQMYSHALATIALCEALGLSDEVSLREPATRALRFIAEAQDPKTGGWRYKPRGGGDTSVLGWQLMALKSGEMAGLPAPPEVYQRAEHWLDSVNSGNHRHLYTYQPGREARTSMTAEALLSRQYLGALRTAESMIAGGDYLKANLPKWDVHHSYYWYYATQVMFHLQGDYWTTWNAKLRPMLVDAQVKDGPAAGSWSSHHPTYDKWADRGGRLYETSLALLMLEVYYRHLPLYQQLNESLPVERP